MRGSVKLRLLWCLSYSCAWQLCSSAPSSAWLLQLYSAIRRFGALPIPSLGCSLARQPWHSAVVQLSGPRPSRLSVWPLQSSIGLVLKCSGPRSVRSSAAHVLKCSTPRPLQPRLLCRLLPLWRSHWASSCARANHLSVTLVLDYSARSLLCSVVMHLAAYVYSALGHSWAHSHRPSADPGLPALQRTAFWRSAFSCSPALSRSRAQLAALQRSMASALGALAFSRSRPLCCARWSLALDCSGTWPVARTRLLAVSGIQ